MSYKLLTEHHLEFLSLTGGCTGSCESTIVKMPLCWKSNVTAKMVYTRIRQLSLIWVYICSNIERKYRTIVTVVVTKGGKG